MPNSSQPLNKLRYIVKCIAIFIFTMFVFHSCFEDKKGTIRSFKDASKVPTLKTTKVSSLISDSGITRYRLVTDEWEVFDKVADPYWFFPKGVYVEKFDSLFHVEASIKADTAYFYENKKLWVLKRNVHVVNLQGEKFDTNLLYWDQFQQKVYSPENIKIEQTRRIITGLGFESNESMTRYQIHKTQGIFDVADSNSN